MLSKIKQNPIKHIRILALILFAADIIFSFAYQTVQYVNFNADIGTFVNVYTMILVGFIPYIFFILYLFVGYEKSKNHILIRVYCLTLSIFLVMSLVASIPSLQIILAEFPIDLKSFWNSYISIKYIGNTVTSIISVLISTFLCVDAFCRFKFIKVSRILLYVKLGIVIFGSLTGLFEIVIGHSRPTVITDALWPGGIKLFLAYMLVFIPKIVEVLEGVLMILFWKYCLGKKEPDSQDCESVATEQ